MRPSAPIVAVIGLVLPVLAHAQDSAMSCQQIMAAVSEQNAIIKQQGETLAQLNNARPDPGDADPAIAKRKAQIKSDRATQRANTLVALGRQKQCFK